MSNLKNVLNNVKAVAVKVKEAFSDKTLKTSDDAVRLQKASLVYLGGQVLDTNLHPISRAYAGALIPYFGKGKGMSPLHCVLFSVAGTSWMFSKNKKKGFVKAAFLTATALSSVRLSEQELVDLALKEAMTKFAKDKQIEFELKQSS